MVKNQSGGNKSKHLARKHINGIGSSTKSDKHLRISENENEMYASVIKTFGNGMCLVRCTDKIERMCIIRNKFRGRNKRDNLILSGGWVLVGLREFESNRDFEKGPKTVVDAAGRTKKVYQKCDLLEIYTHTEQEKLRLQERVVFEAEDAAASDFGRSANIEYVDSTTWRYREIMSNGGGGGGGGGGGSRIKNSYESIYADIDDNEDDVKPLNQKLTRDVIEEESGSDSESDESKGNYHPPGAGRSGGGTCSASSSDDEISMYIDDI